MHALETNQCTPYKVQNLTEDGTVKSPKKEQKYVHDKDSRHDELVILDSLKVFIFHDSKIAQLVLSKVEKASIIKLKDESELNNHDRS